MRTVPKLSPVPEYFNTPYEYAMHVTRNRNFQYPNFPCHTCSGKGTVYDPKTPRCPYEGNKMRLSITCPDCKGSGKGTEEVWKHYRNNALAHWLERTKEEEKERQILISALNKLTEEEAYHLGWKKP